jgi:hypothetical protein
LPALVEGFQDFVDHHVEVLIMEWDICEYFHHVLNYAFLWVI